MKIPFGRPIIGEEEKHGLMEVLDSGLLVHGPKALEFEKKFAKVSGADHCLSVSSCTAGMHLLYFTIGLGPGDEVIVPAQTHVATAHAVELTGAKAVFVDVDPNSGNIDPNIVETAITAKTKAIAVVHYLGVMAEMDCLKEIAKKFDLFLLEDCALAHGASLNGVHAGLHGDAGVFSFYPVKHLTTGEGGAIFLRDKTLAEQLRIRKAFGVDRNHSERSTPGLYDSLCLGFNYRMSELHAAIGVAQLDKLNDFLYCRRKNFRHLEDGIKNLPNMKVVAQPEDSNRKSSFYCMNILINHPGAKIRNSFIDALNLAGIGTSIYYPNPVPRTTYYRNKYGYDPSKFPNAEAFSDKTIALPIGPHLQEKDVDYMIDKIKKIWKKINV
jgi:perosamine synthetase